MTEPEHMSEPRWTAPAYHYAAPNPPIDYDQVVTVPRHHLVDALDLLDIARARLGPWHGLADGTYTALRQVLAASPPT